MSDESTKTSSDTRRATASEYLKPLIAAARAGVPADQLPAWAVKLFEHVSHELGLVIVAAAAPHDPSAGSLVYATSPEADHEYLQLLEGLVRARATSSKLYAPGASAPIPAEELN